MISMMKDRVDNLRRELESGKQQRQALEQRLRDLDATMMRISGAIQVIEEMIAEEKQRGTDPAA